MADVSGGSGTPSRSQIEGWDTTHLETAATHWSTTAEQWEEHFTDIHTGTLSPSGTAWQGTGAEAAQDRTFSDLVKVRGMADHLYGASSIARHGTDDLTWARSQALDAIAEAEEAQFAVGEDLSVTDRSMAPLLLRGAQEARQAQAQEFAETIGSRAQALAAVDKAIAAKITTALAPLAAVRFDASDSPGTKNGVQAVDYKTAPIPEPGTPDDPGSTAGSKGPSAADMRKVLEKLPRGTSDDILEVRSPEDMQNLKRWMTQDGVDGYNRYRDPAKGSWKDLPDGSKVGERNAAKSTGTNSLDIDLQGPDGTEHWKVHINPETGGVPDFAAEPPPAEPPPAESAPGEGAGRAPVGPESPAGGFGGGGPLAGPIGPQPIHLPGSIRHPFPILGEDDPMESPHDFEGH